MDLRGPPSHVTQVQHCSGGEHGDGCPCSEHAESGPRTDRQTFQVDGRLNGEAGIGRRHLLEMPFPFGFADHLDEDREEIQDCQHGPDRRGSRILILTTFDLDEHVYSALRAGASGFLLRDVAAERLFEAVRVIATGDALLAPTVTRRLICEFAQLRPNVDGNSSTLSAGRPLSSLTPRETQTLRLVAEGLSNPEIARRMAVSEETVKTHVSRVLGKLGLRDRTQAVVTAYESGLVIPGSHEPRAGKA